MYLIKTKANAKTNMMCTAITHCNILLIGKLLNSCSDLVQTVSDLQ